MMEFLYSVCKRERDMNSPKFPTSWKISLTALPGVSANYLFECSFQEGYDEKGTSLFLLILPSLSLP